MCCCRASSLLLTVLICVSIWQITTAARTTQETFSEEAVVSPLADGLVLVHLQFTQTAACTRHCSTFPKAVGQLAAAISFESAELSLTQGRWHYHRWGASLHQVKPAGAELRAHFSPTLAPEALPGLWGNLSNALGGLFCASLNFVARPEATAPLTIDMHPAAPAAAAAAAPPPPAAAAPPQQQQQPPASGQPEIDLGQDRQQQPGHFGWVPGPGREQVLYASLPQEASCTENLTPWLKLLPCRDAAGLGRLLSQRSVVFGADYHSLLVRIDVQRDQQQRPIHTTLRQSFTLVLRSPSSSDASSGGSRDPPRPGVLSNITLTDVLGADAPRACPVAATSRLLLQLPQQLQARQQTQSPGVLLKELLQLPAYTTAPAAEAADSTAGESLVPAASSRASGLSGFRRADSWSGPGFTLSPAPDAAAVLPPTDPGCSHGTTAATGSSGGTPGANTNGAAACVPLVFYVWDLHVSPQPPQNPGATLGDAAAGAAVPFSVAWQQQAAAADPADDAAAAAGSAVELSAATAAAAAPQFSVSRFITGTGQLHGGMVLQLTAVQPSDTGHHSTPAAGSSSSSCGGGNTSVCILQVVPWYIRLWLHTLRLSIDGQATPLEGALLPSFISPAQDRKRPLVLDLCLSLPRSVHNVTLTAQFTKAFLRMLEHPPDAHRGFDVPAAVVTVGDSLTPPDDVLLLSGDSATRPGSAAAGSADGGSSGSGSEQGGDRAWGRQWRVVVAEGVSGPAEQLRRVTPLMAQLMQQRPPLVYSPGLVVPLAVPDFSMPYNVICLTSTVLAIFMGGVLNVLLWRPGRDEREAADPKTAVLKKKKKALRLVVLVVGFMAVAVMYDADLQGQLLKQARALGLVGEPAAGQQEL